MDFLEYMYYESLPYIYAGCALLGFSNYDASRVGVVAATVLAACSYLIFYRRFQHRTYYAKY